MRTHPLYVLPDFRDLLSAMFNRQLWSKEAGNPPPKNSIRSQLKITEWSHFLPDFLISFQLLLQRPYRSSNLRMNFQWYRNYAVIFCTVQKELH